MPLDPDFQALADSAQNPDAAAPTQTSPAPASGGLDPDFAALHAQAVQAANPPQESFSWGKFFKEQGSELARSGAKAVWALPGMAMDFGVAARDLIAGKNAQGQYPYELPSTTFNRALDQFTTPPTSTAGKVGELASSMILGSRLPAPVSGSQVPANFQRPLSQAEQNLNEVRGAGYALPPSTVNPTLLNKTVEALGGKTATAQDAATGNMAVTDNLVRKALGMPADAEITVPALDKIRAQAGLAKTRMLQAAGDQVNLDDTYRAGIDKVLAPYKQTSEELGDAFSNPGLVAKGEAIAKDSMTPQSATKAIDILRDNAQSAFQTGDKTTGVAYKTLATNLEDAIDRHLIANGNGDLVNAYRNARTLQAKTYDVQNALNETTGHVNANVLKNSDYLTGELSTIQKAAQIAPKATKEMLDSGSVRNTDVLTGGLAAIMEKKPAFLMYPLARQAVRAGMLSSAGQNKLIGRLPGLFQPKSAQPWQSLFSNAETQGQ